MRKIIKNKVYDTKTAKMLGLKVYNGIVYEIFMKRNREIFLNSLKGIEPISFEKLDEMLDSNDKAIKNSIYGFCNNPNVKERLNLYLDSYIVRKIRIKALESGLTINQYVNKVFENE